MTAIIDTFWNLICGAQIETKSIIRTDSKLHRQIDEAGGRILQHSFQIGKLDLVCQRAGYVVNGSTNKCSKLQVT